MFLILITTLHAAEEIPPAAPPRRSLPAISLLPEGSVLGRVMLPRYDKQRKLTGVLTADRMTLVTVDRILGNTVSLELFKPDRSPRGRIDLTEVLFDQKTGVLRANQPVSILSDSVSANGTGLVYSIDQNKGFLTGPATTRLTNPAATAMNSTSPRLEKGTSIPPLYLVSAFLSLPLLAAPPPLTPEQAAVIEKDAVSRAAEVVAANKAARSDLRASLEASDAANKATRDFLDQADLLAANGTAEPVPAPKPLEIKPDPTFTVVHCQGGMYFDTVAGVFVYLKGVTVNDPGFTLEGANELKIFFDKKPEKPKEKAAAPDKGQPEKEEAPPAPNAADPKKPADPEKPGDLKSAAKKDSLDFGGGNLGDPRKVVATGAVRILQKAGKGKEPVEASGAIFTYDLVTGEIVLSGGFPWFKQGNTFMRAVEPNVSLRIDKNSNLTTEGVWDMGMKLNQEKK